MALLVADVRTESFDKPPPPKKKWIQDYLEKDCKREAEQPLSCQKVVQNVIDQFQDYMDESKRSWANSVQVVIGRTELEQSNHFSRLLDPAKYGDKFNRSLEKLQQTSLDRSPIRNLSRQEIGGVVKGVINQFLNGNLPDSGFRRSRKRCSRHINTKGRDEEAKVSLEDEILAKMPRLLPIHPVIPEPFQDESGVLNLSLPKTGSKVTFATEDNCYSEDSMRSSKTSKSQEMQDREILGHARNTPKPNSVIIQTSLPTTQIFPQVLIKSGDRSNPVAEASPVTIARFPPTKSHFGSIGPGSVINYTKGSTENEVSFKPKPYTVIQPVPLERLLPPKAQDKTINSRTLTKKNLLVQTVPSLFHQPSPIKTAAPTQKSIQDMKPAPRPKPTGRNRNKPEQKKSSNREMHNRLEKNRRALLKKCFDELAVECELDPKKSSNLTVIRAAYKYVLGLTRKERENEKELANLVKDKILKQQKLEELNRNYPGVLPDDN